MTNLEVSICMITFNHEKYIGKALSSVLKQDFNYDYEIVIGDDFSTDSTRDILFEFKKKYPDRIKLILRDKNIGIAQNFSETIFKCSGKYIAIIEGDDYWISSNKIQRQYDLLENNPGFVLSYSNCMEINEISGVNHIVCEKRPKEVDLGYLLSEGWFMRTPTLFFQNKIIKKFPNWFYKAYSTDYILQLLLLEKGNAIKINEVMAVYRKHDHGISVVSAKKQIDLWNSKIKLLDTINEFYNGRWLKNISQQKSDIYFKVVIFSLKNLIFTNLFFLALSRRSNFLILKKKLLIKLQTVFNHYGNLC